MVCVEWDEQLMYVLRVRSISPGLFRWSGAALLWLGCVVCLEVRAAKTGIYVNWKSKTLASKQHKRGVKGPLHANQRLHSIGAV
jgi:hypothetical protein